MLPELEKEAVKSFSRYKVEGTSEEGQKREDQSGGGSIALGECYPMTTSGWRETRRTRGECSCERGGGIFAKRGWEWESGGRLVTCLNEGEKKKRTIT